MEKKNRSEKLIYGIHPVMAAIESGRPLDKIFIRKDPQPERIRDIRQAAREKQIPVQLVPEEKIIQLAAGGNHQGVVALAASVTYHSLEEIILTVTGAGRDPFLVMLDGITDVRNFGAIARSAECLGADALIIPSQGSASVGSDSIRTSAGALSYLPVCRVDHLTDGLMLMQAYQIRLIACTEKGASNLYDSDLSGPVCLIMGSEEKGISTQLLKRADLLVRIPLFGKISSLNVSVASGIALSEIVRQRRFSKKQG
jgi:23S rRNA (guanosine2251-2'-O)-methyltransferase